MSENIPIQIQAQILKRLPIKPLLRFRSVSKPWKRLIDSPDFIVSYGVRHPQPHSFIFGYEDSSFPNSYRDFSFVEDDDQSFVDHTGFFKQRSLRYIIPYYDVLKLGDGHRCVIDSSNGLLCLKIIYHEFLYDDSYFGLSQEMVVLWNPSIRKSIRIPVPYMYDDFPNKNDKIVNAFGFGVCPVTFDPIILKMKWMDKPGISPWRVRVFTLSTGTWNILSTNLPRNSIALRGSQVVIDRFIYWVAFDMMASEDGRSQSPVLIMSFDLTAKEFKEINLTGCLLNRCSSIHTISKLRDSLVLLEYHREFEGDPSVCCLWMMTKEQGVVNRSFTKLYNINVPHATIDKLLGFRNTGELILVTQQRDRGFELEIYAPNTEAIVNLDIHGYDYSFSMCSYMESLILLDQLDNFIYSITN